MMGAPLQTSVFITRHNRILHEANSASASYLFQQDKFYDVSYDTGDKSVQCGRKTDAFKLWFMLKARGEEHFESEIFKWKYTISDSYPFSTRRGAWKCLIFHCFFETTYF